VKQVPDFTLQQITVMGETKLPEFWLRGSLPEINPYLQPVAHALLQAREELKETIKDFPSELLWKQPASAASPGFHLQHLTGVLDRLFTYARGQMLSEEQLQSLKEEGVKKEGLTAKLLLEQFSVQVDKALDQLKATDEKQLTEFRGVGRAQVPSTVLGLLFHAAEHTMRHIGQLLVTVKILKDR
jgi:uncharacterized damage-inducible protein DinB